MIMLRRLCVVGLLFAHSSLHAEYLPEPAAAVEALRNAPAVQQQRAERTAKALASQSLQSGREEWSLLADVAQRRVRTPVSESYPEWGVALSRPLRTPARAAADRTLAEAMRAHADASLDETLHEAGRELLTLWFDWFGEAGQIRLWDANVSLAESQLAAVNARIRLGEAPLAERVNAEAALAQARLQRMQALTRLGQAQSRLLARYPGLPLTADFDLPAVDLPEGSAEAHAEAVLAHNHELERARRHAQFLQAELSVREKRRGIDPALGVFYKNEADGAEHVVGVNLGLTLPGPARRYDYLAAEQSSLAAHAAVARLEARLRQEARADFETARSLAQGWQQAETAAQSLEASARLASRAYDLGEGSLDQVLLSRRLATEARLQAWQAQVTALAAQARLRLDAHALWPGMYGEDDATHP